MKKKIIIPIILLVILASLIIANHTLTGKAVTNRGNNTIDVVYFYGQGCPHCSGLENFLEDMGKEYNLNIQPYETYSNQQNRELFEEISLVYGQDIQGVPTTFIDNKVIIGYSSSIADSIENEISRCSIEQCTSPLEKVADNVTSIIGESSPSEDPEITAFKQKITIPAVIAAAAVDAINPCAFAVLVILLTTILTAGVKKRALYAGLAFSLAIFISYFLMGLGLYSAIQAAGLTHKFYSIVAVLAILIGLFNLKDYLWYGKWFVMEVPLSWRPRLKAILRGITSVPGAFFIGFVVSLFLLPCTSGPYIVILGLLARITTRKYAILLLSIYNLIFILPMLIITTAVYKGATTAEKTEEWRKEKLKVLHLIAGIIILILGIGMLAALFLGYI